MKFCQEVKNAEDANTIKVCVMSEGHVSPHWYADAPKLNYTEIRPRTLDVFTAFAIGFIIGVAFLFALYGGYFA